MKKIFVLAFALFGFYAAQAQGFGIGISGGYLTELDGIGGTADLVYEFDEKWGANGAFTFATADDNSVRSKWFIFDLNARYKVYDELYLLGGGEYITIDLTEQGLSGGNPLGRDISISDSDFGLNAGAGYKYNILDNVNFFVEAKYVFLDQGYFHAKAGLLFDL